EQLIFARRIDASEIEPRQDAARLQRVDDLGRAAAAHADGELVERRRRRVNERVTGEPPDALLQVLRLGEALSSHTHEPLLAEHAHADRHRERAEARVRADVARRALATNVLLARGQREHVPALAVLVDGLAHEASRNLLQEIATLAAREEPRVG